VSNAVRGAKSSSGSSMSSSTSAPVSHAAAAVIAAVTADAIAQRQQEGGSANIAGTVSVWSDVDEAWEEASYQRDARAGQPYYVTDTLLLLLHYCYCCTDPKY
jgi:hypothetical protein